jgi:putative transcriptional regulator
MSEMHVEPGSLLAASPDLRDPNFMHTVVLICQHTDAGAFGLVVNRPSALTVDLLLPDHPLLSAAAFPVHSGGPVGLDTLQFVHRAPERIRGGVELGPGLWLGGELDALAEYLTEHGDGARESVRLLVGYSGWDAGQLENELAHGSWLPARLDVGSIFLDDTTAAWRRVVRSIGERAAGLEDLPPDVSWN